MSFRLPSKLELVGWGLGLIAVACLILVVKTWHDRAMIELPAVRAERDKLKEAAVLREEQDNVNRNTSTSIHNADTATDARDLTPVIVCHKAAVMSPVAEATARTSGAVAPGELAVPPVDTGRDVTAGLTVYGRRCEKIRTRAVGWQDWWREQDELQRK